ncbi:MAG TPA: VOC family protein [Bryobacteraceae bacterium]|nr:VOC family protein [Bryobacteraceae bacterium]
MLQNRSMPRAIVIPELTYPNIGEAIDWLSRAFGFTVRIRMGDHRAQLNVGDGGAIVLTQPGYGASSHSSVMIRVADVDAHCACARRHGARIVREPQDYPYGERQHNAEDFGGHHWCFSQSIAGVDPTVWGGTPGAL